jgi:DeoR/GlpR family transcriptional regulator of sugar metabolism
MIVRERERLILNYLQEHHIGAIAAIMNLTGASIATVRRDINALHRRGLLKKTYGGAEYLAPEIPARPNRMFLPDETDPFFSEKNQAAKLAAGMIKDGDTIFLGAGKTCALLARYITKAVTVVTTSINVVVELAENSRVSMLLLGGTINIGANYIETLDKFTVESLSKYYFDKVFLTLDGIDLEYGYSIINRLQIPLYEYLEKNCADFYLLTISSKYNRRAFTYFGGIDKFDKIIVTPKVDKRYLDYYRSRNIKLYFTES